MDLLTPTDHATAYDWAAVLLAHGFIGAVLAGLAAWAFAALTDMLPWPSGVQLVVIGYGAGWEGAVQRLGAGLADAAVDTLAVAVGAVAAWGLWSQRRRMAAGAVAVLVVVGAAGIWRRRDTDRQG